ncbi:MAG TPA: DegQ family serine endoprotease [Verrucomicrobiae bacterium]
MKWTRSFIGLSSAALVAISIFVTVHYVAQARENAPTIRVENTPVNRDARLGTSFAPIVKKAAPSVVNIYSTRFVTERPRQTNPFFRQFFDDPFQGADRTRTRKEESLGSGVIISPDGYILTANHVVDGADEVKVAIGGDKKEYSATIIGKDAATDVAVLKIDATHLPAVTLGDSDQLEVGDLALAIGNPYGVGQTVTVGIVSALGRSGLHLNAYEDFIQTDAAINPGNSGGALIDAEGRLIGINTAMLSDSGGYQGIGYAVPVNMARHVMERLISGGKITRGYLGIMPEDIDAGLAQGFNLPNQNGALIGDVIANTPAAKAGIQSGDVILSLNGKAISGEEDLIVNISELEPGTQATLKLIRDNVSKTVVATLGKLPETADSNPVRPIHTSSGTNKTDALDGVKVQDLDSSIRAQLNFSIPATVHGPIVTEVARNSNAADAGLQPADIIVEINHQPVTNSDDAVRLCIAAKSDQILVKIWRSMSNDIGRTRFLSVDNTKRPK